MASENDYQDRIGMLEATFGIIERANITKPLCFVLKELTHIGKGQEESNQGLSYSDERRQLKGDLRFSA